MILGKFLIFGGLAPPRRRKLGLAPPSLNPVYGPVLDK